jgi:predicted porin
MQLFNPFCRRILCALLLGIGAAAAAPAALPDSVPAEFPVIIPPGVLFGSFAKGDGPFLIAGSVIVPSGEKLEFGPGCRIYISNYGTITVFGQIVVRGTTSEPVLFRSADPHPNPWDWDRIYCRSRNRSVFENCIIMHSNYGIYVENGSASIDNCLFEKNSLHGVVVRNSDVAINRSTFDKGQVLALMLQDGADVTAESLTVKDNITGVAVQDNARFKMTKGDISGNTNGIAVTRNASVDIIAADITHNRNGITSIVPIPKGVREMVYGNDLDNKIMIKQDMDKLLKPPEAVKSVVLPKAKTEIAAKEDFKSGFAAQKAPVEQTVSFMGNVTGGFKMYLPHSMVDSLPQTHYPGVEGDYISGLQPEFQVFTSGRRKAADINLLMDLYGNEWIQQPLHLKKNTVNLSMNYLDQHLVVGDYFESGSETSISGRKFTGVKYSGEFLPMGKGEKRIEFKLAGGETEIPKDSGEHDPSLYNSIVDSGMSMRQQITYVAQVSAKPTFYSQVNVKGIIARDQGYTPLFRPIIDDPGAPRPIKAQTGCIDGNVKLLDGRLTVLAEIDMGIHDTLPSDTSPEFAKVAWYDPQIGEAVPAVFKSIPDMLHYAVMLGARGSYQGYDMTFSATQIAPQYFSAGNPYLEPDRRLVELTGERQFSDALMASATYDYEQRYRTNTLSEDNATPINKNTIQLAGGYKFGEGLPEVNGDYQLAVESNKQIGTGYDTTRTDTLIESVHYIITDSIEVPVQYSAVEFKHLGGLEVKQRFENGIDYSLKYRILRDNDISKHPDVTEDNLDDEWQHQVTGRFGFKVGRILQNKTSFRITTDRKNRDDKQGLSYKFGDQVKYTIIPRKLSVAIQGDYSNKKDDLLESDTTTTRKLTITNIYSGEGEVKYTATSRLSFSLMVRYEKSFDQTEGSAENYSVKIGGLNVTYLF